MRFIRYPLNSVLVASEVAKIVVQFRWKFLKTIVFRCPSTKWNVDISDQWRLGRDSRRCIRQKWFCFIFARYRRHAQCNLFCSISATPCQTSPLTRLRLCHYRLSIHRRLILFYISSPPVYPLQAINGLFTFDSQVDHKCPQRRWAGVRIIHSENLQFK